MPGQSQNWTCSACALAWDLRACGYEPDCYEQCGVELIGYPQNINPTYGLMDSSGSALRTVLDSYEIPTSQGWLTFDQAYAVFSQTFGCMSGGAWYHWVGVRGTIGSNLWVANSAPGYDGIWNELSRADFNRLGPFSVVWVTQ